MRPRPPKYTVVHSKAEKEYFKTLADGVRQMRERITGKVTVPLINDSQKTVRAPEGIL